MPRLHKNNYTQKAVELAIKGGWNPKRMAPGFLDNLLPWRMYTIYQRDKHKFFLDVEFWRGLEKGLRAKQPKHYWVKKDSTETAILDWVGNTMHSLMDHLLSGDVLESFFKQLLKYHRPDID